MVRLGLWLGIGLALRLWLGFGFELLVSFLFIVVPEGLG